MAQESRNDEYYLERRRRNRETGRTYRQACLTGFKSGFWNVDAYIQEFRTSTPDAEPDLFIKNSEPREMRASTTRVPRGTITGTASTT